ncbi:hypothetical protein [Sorangium sp. So ce1097]|uniref:hypothetical protein n=1 Tax=Sorangium sp. So ce1097 TaxID=3133330 RepID=UPI003F6427C9
MLNEMIELPKLLNALGHMVAGLVAQHEDRDEMRFLQYHDGSGGLHPRAQEEPLLRGVCEQLEAAFEGKAAGAVARDAAA